MDFRQFRYFVAVAEELHVGRAAARLNIAQPALSQQILQLEAQLGAALFTREKRRLALTPAGLVFLGEARLALDQAEHAVQAVRRSERGEIGRIRLGHVDSAMLGPATRRILARFKTTHPDVEIDLQARNVADQFAAILDGRIDAGVLRGPLPPTPASLRCEEIEREDLVVCLPAAHVLATRPAVRAEELRDERFVMPLDPPGIGLAGQIGMIGQEAGFVPKVSQHAGQTTSMVCLVASGFGVAILPASLAQLKLAGIVYRPLRHGAATRLYLLSRFHERQPAVLAFLESCGAVIRADAGRAAAMSAPSPKPALAV